MKKILWLLVLCSMTAVAGEMRAIALKEFQLYKGPAEDYGVNGETVKAGEDLYLIGNSTGGNWVRVGRENGGMGWIPTAQVKLQRVLSSEIYEFQQHVEKISRYTSLIQLDAGLSSGSLPFGKGVSVAGTVNFAPSGVLGINTDQVEFGALFSYYLGKEVFGYIKNDTTKYHLNDSSNNAFLDYGLFGQWLFRSGDRGAFMMGPRGGFLISKLNYGKEYHYPLMAGVVLRYFDAQNFGWSASAVATLDTSIYFVYTFGVSFRF